MDQQALTVAAVTWLAGQGITAGPALTDALTGLYTDGYLVGTASAAAVTGSESAGLDGWAPGDRAAAQDRIDSHGAGPALTVLTAGAAAAAATLTASRIKDAAKALAAGVMAGDAPRTIGTAMHAAMTDPDRAYAAVITETTRGIAAGTADNYRRNGIALGQWQTEPDGNVCPVCDANAAAGPIPIGHAYPSGDTTPPAHPRCRCAVLPA
ncbi:phage minor head protein [Kitasatospora sp. NPDC101157]|uniref:phage minor head protein n=1 Tax=Kitasatospora sp. NPDC101157 TaxID=3364098 RepID=UPI003823C436